MTTHGADVATAVNRAIGGRVAWYMKYSGGPRHTQAELGRLLNVEQSAVSKKLRGDRPFYPHELYRIAAWLDRPLTDFMPGLDDLAAAPAATLAASAPLAQLAEQLTLNQRVYDQPAMPAATPPGRVIPFPDRRRRQAAVVPLSVPGHILPAPRPAAA